MVWVSCRYHAASPAISICDNTINQSIHRSIVRAVCTARGGVSVAQGFSPAIPFRENHGFFETTASCVMLPLLFYLAG